MYINQLNIIISFEAFVPVFSSGFKPSYAIVNDELNKLRVLELMHLYPLCVFT